MNHFLRAGWMALFISMILVSVGASRTDAPSPPGLPPIASSVVAPKVPPPTLPPDEETRAVEERDVPFVVDLAGPEAPSANEVIDLRITIERQLPQADPMQISVELPPGVELVRGALESVLTDGETRRIERTIRVSIGEALPTDDLIVTLGQRGAGWSAHATKRYRFGRPGSEPAPPERDERPVILDGKNHGRPIRLR